MHLRSFLSVLHGVYERSSLLVWHLSVSVKNVLERNIFSVPGARSFAILVQFRPIQRSANECALAAGIGEDPSFPAPFGRSLPAHWACRSGYISTHFDVTCHQVVHTLIVHDEHQQVAAFTANLRTPADAGNREWRRRAPAIGAGSAGGYSRSMFTADNECSFHQLRNDGDAFCPLKDLFRYTFVRSRCAHVFNHVRRLLQFGAASSTYCILVGTRALVVLRPDESSQAK